MLLTCICAVFLTNLFIVTGLTFSDTTAENFNSGTHFRTFYNTSKAAVQLNATFSSGNFTSRIFDAGSNSSWNTISWLGGVCYQCELPANGVVETGDFIRKANMTGNVLLIHLNESSGTTFFDFSGNAYNGTCSGAACPASSTAGKFGRALDFETTGTDDYLNFTNPSGLNSIGSQITLEAWIRAESFPGTAPTILDKDWQRQYSLYINSASGTARGSIVTPAGQKVLIGRKVHSAATWYHLVLTYNGSTVSLYSDGVLDNSTTHSGAINTSTKNFLVGSGWQGGNPIAYTFDGLIDEAAVYNRALSVEEVQDHYLRGVARLNVSVLSCDDVACNGESFIWLNDSSPQTLAVSNTTYFQYKFDFLTSNASFSPELFNVSVEYLPTDNVPPNISIAYPSNTTYTSTVTAFNYTVYDTNVQTCWYSTNAGVTNTTVVCGTNVTGLTSSQGSNTWRVYANDSFGNSGSSSITFALDDSAPAFLDYQESPTNGSSYSSGEFYEFTVDVFDNSLDQVYFEWEGTNYSSYEMYAFNRTDVAAGAYSYRWWANDTNGNLNSSGLRYYTVSKKIPEGSLTNSGGWSVTYPTALTIGLSESNAGDGDVTYSVLRDGVSLGVGETSTLAAGSYVYVLNTTAGQNYTANASMHTQTLTVAQAAGNVTLHVNQSSANITIAQGSAIYLNATLVAGTGAIQLYNNGTLIHSGSSPLSNLTTFSGVGTFNITVLYSGNTNYTSDSETLYVTVTGPSLPDLASIAFASPANITYANSSVLINITSANASSVWFFNGTGNESYSTSVYRMFADGSHTLFAYANNSVGNESSASVSFSVNTSTSNETLVTGVAPQVLLFYPSFASVYGNNSVPLNFSVTGQNVSSCWYTLDGGVSFLLPSCSNTTLGLSSGFHTINLYANESVEGLTSSNQTSFFVSTNNPTVHLLSLEEESYINTSSTLLHFIPFFNQDVNCSLFANLNGTYLGALQNGPLASGAEASFNATNLTEGNYTWAVSCIGVTGNASITGNRTFFTDYTSPIVNSTLQNETVFTPGPVTFNYTVNDTSPTKCVYSIAAAASTQLVLSSEAEGCENTVVQITVIINTAGNYNLNFGAQDQAGNSQSSQQGFSVQSSGGGGGSAGGGGGTAGVTGVARAVFQENESLELKAGEETRFSVGVRNTGARFLNNCRLRFSSPLQSWIASDRAISLASGEQGSFDAEIQIPRGTNPGLYRADLTMECNEATISQVMSVTVINPDIEIEFNNYTREAIDRLVIAYTLQYFTGEDLDATVRYTLKNLAGVVLTEGDEQVSLPSSELQQLSLQIPLPKDAFGEFTLVLSVETSDARDELEQPITLSSRGISGFAISDGNAQTLRTFAWYLFAAIIVFIVFRYVLVHYRRRQPPHKNKHLIHKNYHPPHPHGGSIWKAVFNLRHW